MSKYKQGDVVRFRNTLYSAWDKELFLIENVYVDGQDVNYGARPLIPVHKLRSLIESGKITPQTATSNMLVHEHELQGF